jgi:hypothetical protein
MKNIFNLYKENIEQSKNSQNAKKIQALGFFRVPIGAEMKKNQHVSLSQAG